MKINFDVSLPLNLDAPEKFVSTLSKIILPE